MMRASGGVDSPVWPLRRSLYLRVFPLENVVNTSTMNRMWKALAGFCILLMLLAAGAVGVVHLEQHRVRAALLHELEAPSEPALRGTDAVPAAHELERRLAEIMVRIHEDVRETADEFGAPGNYVVGANIAGLLRVAKAMLALGLV